MCGLLLRANIFRLPTERAEGAGADVPTVDGAGVGYASLEDRRRIWPALHLMSML